MISHSNWDIMTIETLNLRAILRRGHSRRIVCPWQQNRTAPRLSSCSRMRCKDSATSAKTGHGSTGRARKRQSNWRGRTAPLGVSHRSEEPSGESLSSDQRE
jgi:hypothetical protein